MTDFSDLPLDQIVAHLRHERSRSLLVEASLACVGKAYDLQPDDLAYRDLIAAGQTFATLAVAEGLAALPGDIEHVLGRIVR